MGYINYLDQFTFGLEEHISKYLSDNTDYIYNKKETIYIYISACDVWYTQIILRKWVGSTGLVLEFRMIVTLDFTNDFPCSLINLNCFLYGDDIKVLIVTKLD